MKTLVLVGSGEFTSGMKDVDRHLLSFFKNPTVSVFPTAAGQEPDASKWIEMGVSHFESLSAKAIGIPIYNKFDIASGPYVDAINKSSFMYFSGGDPGYLLEVINETPLWKLIYDKYNHGSILAGSSAGAMIMGSYVLMNAQQIFIKETEKVPIWHQAFSLIPYTILPHYDAALRDQKEIVEFVMNHSPEEVKNHWLGIDENTALIITNEKEARVMGKGSVHVVKEGNQKIYKSGNQFHL